MLDVMGADIDLPVFQAFVKKHRRGMQAFAKDGIVVLQQISHQFLRFPGIDDERRETQLLDEGSVAIVWNADVNETPTLKYT